MFLPSSELQQRGTNVHYPRRSQPCVRGDMDDVGPTRIFLVSRTSIDKYDFITKIYEQRVRTGRGKHQQ